MGHVRELYICEHYVIRKIRENFQVHGIQMYYKMAKYIHTYIILSIYLGKNGGILKSQL